MLSAIGHELIERGHKVLFRPTALLVQDLLIAKRELRLERELKRLDRYEAVILDDIGYVQQDREEMEVLFTFLAARYERRSVLITSNLLFSEWERIFKDPMTTAAAIDRLVHHSVILELTGKSVRAARLAWGCEKTPWSRKRRLARLATRALAHDRRPGLVEIDGYGPWPRTSTLAKAPSRWPMVPKIEPTARTESVV